jgi:hypothetical protein
MLAQSKIARRTGKIFRSLRVVAFSAFLALVFSRSFDRMAHAFCFACADKPNDMTALSEKIANLPPSLLPKVEHFIDHISKAPDDRDCWHYGRDWGPPPVDENGEPVHPKFGCMKGFATMNDNFFEPDDDWEDYM